MPQDRFCISLWRSNFVFEMIISNIISSKLQLHIFPILFSTQLLLAVTSHFLEMNIGITTAQHSCYTRIILCCYNLSLLLHSFLDFKSPHLWPHEYMHHTKKHASVPLLLVSQTSRLKLSHVLENFRLTFVS